MSTTPKSGTTPSAFEQQRAELVQDVQISMENVLQKINRLNRNLEGIIAVGTELGQVESLWSQFEGVMSKDGQDQPETVTQHETTTQNT